MDAPTITQSALATYVGVTALLVLAPGMGTAVVMRNASEGGHRAGLITAAGVAVGNATWGLAAGLGLGLLIGRMPGALDVLRGAGAACLVWLGWKSLRRAWQVAREGDGGMVTLPAHARRARALAMFGEGAVTNLLNPSIPVFYIATVPQFVRPGPWFTVAFIGLSAIHVGMALACHSTYALAFGRLANALSSRGRAWVLHAVTGAALVGLAVLSVQKLR